MLVVQHPIEWKASLKLRIHEALRRRSLKEDLKSLKRDLSLANWNFWVRRWDYIEFWENQEKGDCGRGYNSNRGQSGNPLA